MIHYIAIFLGSEEADLTLLLGQIKYTKKQLFFCKYYTYSRPATRWLINIYIYIFTKPYFSSGIYLYSVATVTFLICKCKIFRSFCFSAAQNNILILQCVGTAYLKLLRIIYNLLILDNDYNWQKVVTLF